MKPFHFSAPAAEELTEAIRWYENRRRGLGGDFHDAIVRAIDLIRSHPDIGTPGKGRFSHRPFRVTLFPYKIVYRVREDDLYVVAVAHASRRPNY